MGIVKPIKKNNNNQQISVDNLMEIFKSKYLSVWWQASTDMPSFDKVYGYREKREKEKSLDHFTKILAKNMKELPTDKDRFDGWRDTIMGMLRSFVKDTLEYREAYLEIIFSEGYATVTNEFIKEAKRFDSSIDVFDIFQAIRNVWIMNSIQIFLGEEVTFTPAIFGYSMLYPYSDNYLDDPKYSQEEKINFNKRFRRRLEGEDLLPENQREACIFDLVAMIEAQFSRQSYPCVYEGLLAIHTGQEKSLTQQKGCSIPYERDILGISFEKGGASVLADGYLIKGRLTQEEADFMYGYGVFLQLADDLQDIKEDYNNNHMTVFSQLAYKWPLDKITNRLFGFMEEVLELADTFTTPLSEEVKGLIETSCNFLIFEAIAKNQDLYTKDYINAMNKHYMFRFSYQKKLKKKLRKRFRKIDVNKMDSVLSNYYYTI